MSINVGGKYRRFWVFNILSVKLLLWNDFFFSKSKIDLHSKTNWTDQFYICNICKTKKIQDRRIFSEAHTSKRLLVVNGLKIFTQWVTHLWAICSKHIICYIYHKKHVKTARLILGEWGHSGRIKKHELFFWSCLFLPVSRWVISWAGNQN